MTKDNRDADIAVLIAQVSELKADIKDIKDALERKYPTFDRFLVVERIVYGLVSILLIGVLGAIMRLVITV